MPLTCCVSLKAYFFHLTNCLGEAVRNLNQMLLSYNKITLGNVCLANPYLILRFQCYKHLLLETHLPPNELFVFETHFTKCKKISECALFPALF